MTTTCPGCHEETLDFQLLSPKGEVPRGYFKQIDSADLMAQGCNCALTDEEIERAGVALVERVNAGRAMQ